MESNDKQIIDMVNLIDEEFFEDELFREIKVKYPEICDELYPDWIHNLNLEKEYTTLEVSQLLNKGGQNIRYYMTQLQNYVQPLKHNRNYRLTYKSIYRLHMIFLLVENGRTVFDIKVILPIYGEFAFVENANSEVVEQRILAKGKEFNEGLIDIFLVNLMKYIKVDDEYKFELQNLQFEYIQNHIEERELQDKIEEQHNLIRKIENELGHLKDNLVDIKAVIRSENQLKNMTTLINKHNQENLFKRLKRFFIDEEVVLHYSENHHKIDFAKEEVDNKMAELEEAESVMEQLQERRKQLIKISKEQLIELQLIVKEMPRLTDNTQLINVMTYFLEGKEDE